MMREGRYQFGPIAAAVVIFEVIASAIWISVWWVVRTQVPAFRLARPIMLWLMVVGLLFALIYLLDVARRNRALGRFSSMELLPRMVPGVSSASSLFKFLLLRHGLSFAVIAAAGPQIGTQMEEVKARGVDVMVALDVSNSMLAEDLRPSRMEVARRALEQLIERLHGDRLGIVVFAGQAYVQLPITTDRSAARLFLNNVGPGMVPTQGTAIGAAIQLAQRSFNSADPTSKTIIVITDGENHEDDAEGAARAAADSGIVVNTIGMGTTEGAPIPIKQGSLVHGFKKDRTGGTVVSKLNEAMLQQIAAAGNGEYVQATSRDAGIDQLLLSLRQMDQTETGSFRYTGYSDRYRPFVVIACVLIFVSLMLGERRLPRPKWMTNGP